VTRPFAAFRELVAALPDSRVRGRTEGVRVRGLAADSHEVKAGDLFVCLKGAQHDGHAFAPEAVRRGAVAVVAGRPLRLAVPVVTVGDTRPALGRLSAAFWGYPSRRLDVVGVTGTKGKTTTAFMLEAVLGRAGLKPALFGTVENRFGSRRFPHVHTTPQAHDLQRMLAEVLRLGARSVAMEVSSHSLVLSRVEGTAFRAGVFTNLTRDHLDFHRTMEAYFDAKALLFRGLPPGAQGGVAAVNCDNPAGREMARLGVARAVRFSASGRRPGSASGHRRGTGPELWATDVKCSPHGTVFTLNGAGRPVRVSLRLPGVHNVENALAAAGAAWGMGIAAPDIAAGLAALKCVPGRMERVPLRAPFTVIVDYAHTPDSLDRVLKAARELAPGRVIAVFGCGGNRDRGKRPIMGGIAVRRADLTLVTSDNPRNEAPDEIVREITAGIRRAGRHVVEPDRRKAIGMALRAARAGDMVVIAGKGHEKVQIVRGRELPFDDVKVAGEEWRQA
jgi:UDP-N-acetylmuramoyl-L-alanyl-D-glutamate--2,6-diaminopimelate ligase